MKGKVKELKNKYQENRIKSRNYFIILALISSLYLFFKNEITILFSFIIFLIIFLKIKKQNNQWKNEFIKLEKISYEQLKNNFKNKNIDKITAGYLQRNNILIPIIINKHNKSIYILENHLEKELVISINKENWYLISYKEKNIFSEQYNEFIWKKEIIKHYELLKKFAEKEKNIKVMEYFLYGKFLENIKENKFASKIIIGNESEKLQKEKMYSTTLNDSIIYLTESSWIYLYQDDIKNGGIKL